jgi:hypothetical protein
MTPAGSPLAAAAVGAAVTAAPTPLTSSLLPPHLPLAFASLWFDLPWDPEEPLVGLAPATMAASKFPTAAPASATQKAAAATESVARELMQLWCQQPAKPHANVAAAAVNVGATDDPASAAKFPAGIGAFCWATGRRLWARRWAAAVTPHLPRAYAQLR